MSPLPRYVVTFLDTTVATVEVEADSADDACDLALRDYRAEPEAFIEAGGEVRVIRCEMQTGETSA